MSEETKGATPEVAEKKPNYINKLQEENAELKRKLEAVTPKAEEDDGTPDDRLEEVEVSYGKGAMYQDNPQCHWKEKMTKTEALNTLYQFYARQKPKDRMIPREDFEFGKPLNTATCYMKFTKTDITGEIVSGYKDLPLWLAAERKVNHPRCVYELVKKSEYDRFYNARSAKETEQEKEMLRMSRERKELLSMGN